MDAPAKQPLSPAAVLANLLRQAKAGDLTDVVVVYEKKDGGTDVASSSMSVIQANHLWRVFDGRVRRMYAQVEARSRPARSPTAGVSANSSPRAAQVVAKVKRSVRRALEKEQRRAQKKAARGPAPPPPPATN